MATLAPPPDGPHGLYDFGFPSALIDIHFPHGPDQKRSTPWFWFITPQIPFYFQYLGSQVGGQGWQCKQFLPIIKILPIDHRQLVPTTQVGFSSVTEVATLVFNGAPISGNAWGRFKLGSPGKRFWDVIGQKKPEFTASKGILTSKTIEIGPKIKQQVARWKDFWNTDASLFNAAAQNVQGTGEYSTVTGSAFSVPFPPPNIPAPALQAAGDKYYFGPLPSTYVFNTGNAEFWKGAFSFRMDVGQLDPTVWDMSVFPPQLTTDPLSTRIPSAVSGNYGGYSLTSPDFPQVGLNIN